MQMQSKHFILDVLRDVAENGLPQEQVAASLHQLELSQREVSGGGYPYGLKFNSHLTHQCHPPR